MRDAFITLFFIFFLLPLMLSQQLEFFGGPVSMTYFHSAQGSRETTHEIPAASIHLSVNDVMILDLPFSVRLSWTSGVRFHSRLSGSQAGNAYAQTRTVWRDLGIGLYPVNLVIARHIHLDIGGEFIVVLSEESYTAGHWWTMNDPHTTYYYQQTSTVKEDVYFGAIGRISYPINIKANFALAPQYHCFLGLSPEFTSGTKTFRQALGVAFLIRLAQPRSTKLSTLSNNAPAIH